MTLYHCKLFIQRHLFDGFRNIDVIRREIEAYVRFYNLTYDSIVLGGDKNVIRHTFHHTSGRVLILSPV